MTRRGVVMQKEGAFVVRTGLETPTSSAYTAVFRLPSVQGKQ